MVKRGDSRDEDRVGICLGNTYQSRYETLVMVKFNRDDYCFTTWVPLKKIYGFVVLCAGVL